MEVMNEIPGTPEGLRERKRRKTRQRIIDEGFRLFAERGFAEATLEAIADASEVSRRTLLYYFESKEDILIAKLDPAGELLREAVVAAVGATPFEVLCNATIGLISKYQNEEFPVIDELLRSTPSLEARRQAHYESQERIVSAALSERWPEPERQAGLRLVAMFTIGAVRLTLDAWRKDGRPPILPKYLEETFKTIEAEF